MEVFLFYFCLAVTYHSKKITDQQAVKVFGANHYDKDYVKFYLHCLERPGL